MQKANKSRAVPRVNLRMVVGAAIILACVVGVFFVIQFSSRTTLVYAAAVTLSPGDQIVGTSLTPVSVNLGDAATRYVPVGGLPETAFVGRTVVAGELLPADAFQSSASTENTRMVLNVTGPLSEKVTAGVAVDIWFAAAGGEESNMPPLLLTPSLTVARVLETKGIFGQSGSASIEVVVPKTMVSKLLAAANADGVLSAVPAAAEPEK